MLFTKTKLPVIGVSGPINDEEEKEEETEEEKMKNEEGNEDFCATVFGAAGEDKVKLSSSTGEVKYTYTPGKCTEWHFSFTLYFYQSKQVVSSLSCIVQL